MSNRAVLQLFKILWILTCMVVIPPINWGGSAIEHLATLITYQENGHNNESLKGLLFKAVHD